MLALQSYQNRTVTVYILYIPSVGDGDTVSVGDDDTVSVDDGDTDCVGSGVANAVGDVVAADDRIIMQWTRLILE